MSVCRRFHELGYFYCGSIFSGFAVPNLKGNGTNHNPRRSIYRRYTDNTIRGKKAWVCNLCRYDRLRSEVEARTPDRTVFEHSAGLLEKAHKVSLGNHLSLAAEEKPYENDCALVYGNHYFNVRNVYGIVSRRRITTSDVLAGALPSHPPIVIGNQRFR